MSESFFVAELVSASPSCGPRVADPCQSRSGTATGRQSWYALHDRLSESCPPPDAGRLSCSRCGWTASPHRRTRSGRSWWRSWTLTRRVRKCRAAAARSQLHHADLLAGDIPPDAVELLSRRDRQARAMLHPQPALADVGADFRFSIPDTMSCTGQPARSVRPLLEPVRPGAVDGRFGDRRRRSAPPSTGTELTDQRRWTACSSRRGADRHSRCVTR